MDCGSYLQFPQGLLSKNVAEPFSSIISRKSSIGRPVIHPAPSLASRPPELKPDAVARHGRPSELAGALQSHEIVGQKPNRAHGEKEKLTADLQE